MFMRAILPQERLQVIIDNSVQVIDVLDGHALLEHRVGRYALRRGLGTWKVTYEPPPGVVWRRIEDCGVGTPRFPSE
jgi:hypothetical protein